MNYGKVNFEGTEIKLTENAYETSRAFPGNFNDAEQGETYIDEWKAEGKDDVGNIYRVIWQFEQTKGQEIEPDSLPWEDDNYIVDAEIIQYYDE